MIDVLNITIWDGRAADVYSLHIYSCEKLIQKSAWEREKNWPGAPPQKLVLDFWGSPRVLGHFFSWETRIKKHIQIFIQIRQFSIGFIPRSRF